MKITQITRSYSRSILVKTPDKEFWIKQEMTLSAEPDENEDLKTTSDALGETCRREVGAAITAERKKIEAAAAAAQEPFPDKMPVSKVQKMPKL